MEIILRLGVTLGSGVDVAVGSAGLAALAYVREMKGFTGFIPIILVGKLIAIDLFMSVTVVAFPFLMVA